MQNIELGEFVGKQLAADAAAKEKRPIPCHRDVAPGVQLGARIAFELCKNAKHG